MKILVTLTTLVLAFSLTAIGRAETAQPIAAIPTPQGATVVTEMTVTQEQLDVVLFMFMSGGSDLPEVDVERLKTALAPLESAQYAEMNIKGDYSATDILATFQREVSGRRLIYDTGRKPGGGTIVIATADGYFGAAIDAVDTKSDKNKQCRIRAVRTVGFPDVGELASIVADPEVLTWITSRK